MKPYGVYAVLLAALGGALCPSRSPAQAQGIDLQRPLMFYEMARRQGRTDVSCEETARQVQRVINQYGKQAPQLLPAWYLRLGDAWRAAGKDREALAAFGNLLALPAQAPVSDKGPYKDLASYRREAELNQTILLARLGALSEARAKLMKLELITSRERILAAEARLLNHDRVADLLSQIGADGHPERNWGHYYNPLRAAMIAHAANEPELVARYAGPIAKRGAAAEKWPHWKSAWAQADQLVRFSSQGQLRTTGLANGTYSGASTGFYAPLNVEIKVDNGMLASVRVVKHREDRPRNALDGFVKRLKGPSPLAIDAVTGATQTCHGVLLATEEALRKAAPRGLPTLSQTR